MGCPCVRHPQNRLKGTLHLHERIQRFCLASAGAVKAVMRMGDCMQRGNEFFCFFIGTDVGGMCGVRIARSTDPWGQPGSW